MVTKKGIYVSAIVIATVLIENFFAYCYFDGERGFLELLLCGFFAHIIAGLVAWAIASMCIRGGTKTKIVEGAPDTSSNTTQSSSDEQKLPPLRKTCETKVENPENVTDMGLLVIPSTVQTIKKEAYAGCLQLKKVVLMEGVATIEDYAFKGCRNLRCIKIPSSVKIIGAGVFDGCGLLTRIEVDDLKSWLNVSCRYDLFYGAPPHELVVGDKIIETFEPGDVGSVCPTNRDAFRQCSSLKAVVFSNSTKRIAMSFANCENLKRVALPECLDFWDCNFWHCSNLSEVRLPKTVQEEICGNPFSGVPNVVEVEGGLRYLCGWCVGGSVQDSVSVRFRDGTYGIASGVSLPFGTVRELIFPNSVQCVGAGSLGMEELRRIIFEGRTPVCGDGAFEKQLLNRVHIEVVVNDGDWKYVAKQFGDTSRFVVIDANIRREELGRERNLGIVERPNSPRWIPIRCSLCRSRIIVDRYYLARKLDAGEIEMPCPDCGGSFPVTHVHCPQCGKCHVYGEDIEGRLRMPGIPEYDYCSRCGDKIKVLEAYVDPMVILQDPDACRRSDVMKWLYRGGVGIREVLRTKGYSEDEFIYRVAQLVKVSGWQITDTLAQLDSMYFSGHRERLIEVVMAIMRG